MSLPKTCSLDSLSMTGPFEQTLFLGCSIVSFTANAAWDNESSSMTVQLVKDDCITSKVYWDVHLDKKTENIADPGFIGLDYDIVGCPVYFRLGEFEFSGLVQKWEESNSSSGKPTYSVTIVDPRQLLENSKVILNDYAGGVSSTFNVFNVFGYLESFGVNAPQLSLSGGAYINGDINPDGATFGSPAAGFGGAQVNGGGMLWRNLVAGINILCNSIPMATNQWSPYGRVTYKAINTAGYGLLAYDRTYVANMGGWPEVLETQYYAEYFLDLSELPSAPTYYRISGTSTDILNFITTLCNDAGYNFYIELVYVKNAYALSPSGIAKFIKVRTVRRLSQPDLGIIADFIGTGIGAIETKRGVELRNETTSAICFGGPKETLYQLTGNNITDDYILPYFGIDSWTDNTIIPTRDDNDEWQFLTNTTLLNTNLSLVAPIGSGTTINGYNYAYITELELMAARAGFDMWISTATALSDYTTTISGVSFPMSSTGKSINLDEKSRGIYDIANIASSIMESVSGTRKFVPQDLLDKNFNKTQQIDKMNSKRWEEIQLIHKWVCGFAENFGKKFQMRVPYTCARIDEDNAQILTSESPTNGGWTEQNVLGLDRNSAYIGFLQQDNNQICSMLVFDDSSPTGTSTGSIPKDVSYLGDSFGILNNRIYVKADVEPSYVYENRLAATGPRVVLSMQGPIPLLANDNIPQGCRGLFTILNKIYTLMGKTTGEIASAKTKIQEGYNIVGSKILNMAFPYYNDTNPCGGTCGIHSNIMTYGPWVKLGPVGGTRVEQDTSLVPWEYNGYANMNLAGQSKADEGVTRMRVGEMGDIIVPGYPTVPLGAELGAVAGGVYGAGQNLIENRVHSLRNSDESFNSTMYGFYDSTGGWTGLWGPNITSIQVSVGSQGVQTTYSMRTFTPKFGRFSKQNADRLKTIGQLQIKAQHAYTKWLAPRLQGQYNSELRTGARPYRITLQDMGVQTTNMTPHHLFAGSFTSDISGFKAATVVSNSFIDMHNEMSGWSGNAFMSLDGLLRPVSLDGAGGLPRLATPKNSGINNTMNSQPPLSQYTNPTVYELHNLPIFAKQLQPFQNPPGFNNSVAMDRAISGGSEGHDIAMVGRDNTMPSSLMLSSLSGTKTYSDDYKIMALKGPLLLHSWGYDTEGRPVPNSGDRLASSGRFEALGQGDKFSENWLRQPETWPVAPVDLRYDRTRGVWTTPPSYSLIIAQLSSGLSPSGYTTAKLLHGQNVYDSDGVLLSYNNLTVNVHDKLTQSHPSGDIVYLYYNSRATGLLPIPHTGEYHIIAGGMSMRCSGKLTEALTVNRSGTFVDNIGPIDGLSSPVSSCADGVGLMAFIQLNPHGSGGYTADDNTVCYLERHFNDNTWWIYAMPCQD